MANVVTMADPDLVHRILRMLIGAGGRPGSYERSWPPMRLRVKV